MNQIIITETMIMGNRDLIINNNLTGVDCVDKIIHALSSNTSGITINRSFNRLKIYLMPSIDLLAELKKLGVSEKTAEHINRNTQDIGILQQQVENLRQSEQNLNLRYIELEEKTEKLSEKYSHLADNEKERDPVLQKELDDIRAEYDAEISRLNNEIVKLNERNEQTINDLKDSIARGYSDIEAAAKEVNDELIREVKSIEKEIRKLKKERDEAISKKGSEDVSAYPVEYEVFPIDSVKEEIVQNDKKDDVVDGGFDSWVTKSWRKKMPSFHESIKRIISQVPVSERKIYQKSEEELQRLGYCITVNNNVSDSRFDGKEKLLSVILSEGITAIGNNAFFGCKRLIRVYIPKSVKIVGKNAFAYCNRYLEIYCGAESLPDDWDIDWNPNRCSVTWNCYCKENITNKDSVLMPNSKDKAEYPSLQNYERKEFSINGITLKKYKGSGGVADIPDGVKIIEDRAFAYCNKLTGITIPISVQSIGMWAFANCAGLKSITVNGTKAQWGAINKNKDWDKDTGNYTVHCTDGDIVKS